MKDLSTTDAVTFNGIKEKLNQWELNLKIPIWIEPEDWNTVTEMIYDDLMNNKPIRLQTPADLNKLK